MPPHPFSIDGAPLVLRYKRTDTDRLGPWQPVDSSWRTAASAGLVTHDIYHHLPGDTGTFAQEIATIGAEWFIDVQPLPDHADQGFLRGERALRRAIADSVLNALDAPGAQAYGALELPAPWIFPGTALERALFESLSDHALQAIPPSLRPADVPEAEFKLRLVAQMAQGAAQARERFPDQARVRAASRHLARTIADLDESEVPLDHEITLTLTGYDTEVTYADADAGFLAQHLPLEAKLMLWCSDVRGYPRSHATLHACEASYRAFLREHFEAQADAQHDGADGTDPGGNVLPEAESYGLRRVYVVSDSARERLRRGQALTLTLAEVGSLGVTPRGVWIL